MDAERKETPEEAIARTGMALYRLGVLKERSVKDERLERDRLLEHLMELVEDAKADATARYVPTVEDLTAALARGDLVAKARANAKGFAIQFFDRAGAEKVTVSPHVDRVPSVPTTLEAGQKGEVTLREALVDILEQEGARNDRPTLRARVTERIFALVRPASETALVANQKTDWFVSRAIGWLERQNMDKVTRRDLEELVGGLAARKR
jgi:hypothetical protein